MYHLSSPSDFDGNFSSTALKSARASSSVGSRGIGISLLAIMLLVYREWLEVRDATEKVISYFEVERMGTRLLYASNSRGTE
jgi:hypothetical protein